MPGFGQVDYSLVRPLTTGAERMQQMESLGTMREQRAGMRQDRRFQAERQQMGRAEYERDLKQIEDVRQAVIDNTVDDKLDQDGFVRSLYSIDPKLAIEAQTAYGRLKSTPYNTTEADVDNALSVLAQDKNIGENSTAYKLLSAVKNNPKLASTMLADIGDINKAYEMIPRDVQKEEELRPGKVKTSSAITAANVGTKIKTEADLSDVTASTEGKIAGAKKISEREAGVTLSESSAERLGDFDASLSQLKTLSESFSNPDAPQGPVAQLRKTNPYDWQAQAKQQLVAATKQMVGKALEGGVLRKEDESKYNKILPTIGDTYQSAIQKTKNLETMLDNARNAKIGALNKAGYAVDKFNAEKTDDGWTIINGIKIRKKAQ